MDAVADPRFARLHSDPRFQRLPKQQSKVKVDKRFSRLFTDKEFQQVQTAPVDRQGKKAKGRTANRDLMQRRFELDQQEEEPAKKQKRRKAQVAPSPAKPAPSKAKRPAAVEDERFKMADDFDEDEDEDEDDDGEPDEDEAEDDDEVQEEEDDERGEEGSTTEDDSDDEDVEGVEGEEGEAEEEQSALLSFIEQQASVPRVEDATSRLAVVNCDWEQVRAVDLLAILRSFVPSGGSIHTVAVYLSDFGAERQRKEGVHGPSGIWERPEDEGEEDDGDGDGDEAEARLGDVDGGKVDNEKLRKYELERYKYYYAVVSCDSARTAEVLYNECDGAELEASSMVLDLRFIPDSMGFARAPRDEAREVPPKYKLPSFAASALQSSTVTPTWDADDHERKQAMQRNFKKSELREIDYAAYLASDSDEDGGVEEYPFVDAPLAPPREKSRATLQALRGDAGDEGGDDADDEGGDGLTHELTYLPGLEGRAREKARRRELGLPDAAAPSVFELEEQKRREKAKQRKQQRLAARNGGSAAAAAGGTGGTARGAEEDEMPAGVEDDPFFAEAMAERDEEEERAARPQKQKRAAGAPSGAVAGSSSSADAGGGGAARKGRKGKKGRPALSAEEREEEARRAAELELLVMDGDDDPRGFDAKRLELPAGGRGLKGKKRAREAAAAAAAASAADDGFQLDTADPRFQQLYNSHEYAIDPTHPKFKRTVASEQLMAEVSRRHVAEPPKAEPQRPRSSDPALAKLVSSLKSKASSKAKAKPAKAAQRPPKRALSS